MIQRRSSLVWRRRDRESIYPVSIADFQARCLVWQMPKALVFARSLQKGQCTVSPREKFAKWTLKDE